MESAFTPSGTATNTPVFKMSKTIQISSPAQFSDLLKSSRIVVTDCKLAPLTPPPKAAAQTGVQQLRAASSGTCADIKTSLCRLVWAMQANCPDLRTAVGQSLPPKPHHIREGQCRHTKGNRVKIRCHGVSTLVRPRGALLQTQ